MYTHRVPHNAPVSSILLYWLGRLWMWFFGWRVVGSPPNTSKFIVIAAPHTSNWDLPFMLAAFYVYRLKASWMGKHTLFRPPFDSLMRWLGGIPINRSSPSGVVAQMTEKFRATDKLAVAIAPAGTRKKMDFWRSGFYRIAYSSQIPLTCGYLDYTRKEAGLGLSFIPTGDMKSDMEKIRSFYDGIIGKNPDIITSIRLRDEE